MKKPVFFWLFALLIAQCNPITDLPSEDLIIQNVRLFDGEKVVENATVLTENGMVTDIITQKVTSYTGQNVIKGDNRTLVPGLINAHVHASKKEHLAEAARDGVLTLLDLFNKSADNTSRLRSLRDSAGYAYYYSAGRTVTVPGGHGTQFGEVPTVKKASEVAGFVEDRLEEGSDYIKLILERGQASNPLPTLTKEMMEQAIQTAGEKGVISVVHISRRSDAIEAAKLGVSGLAHIWSRDSAEISDLEVTLLREKNVFIIPTLYVYKKAAREAGRSINLKLPKNDLLRLHQAGVSILAGTDAPNFGIDYGTDLISEMKLLVESGLTEIEALKSATSLASESFRLGERGLIRVGYSADFILIDGNPIEEIGDLTKIVGVWKQGQSIVKVQ